MKLKHVKLYRSITINGMARESVSHDAVSDLMFNDTLKMVSFKDRRKFVYLVPLTNVEHMMPEETFEFIEDCMFDDVQTKEKPKSSRKKELI